VRRMDRTTLAEFLGDAVVYRNLTPLDPRLPRYAELADRAGLPPDIAPRKSDPGYARVVAELVRSAARLCGTSGSVERILFVGDTRGNDATAFGRLCAEGGWPGIGFIGCEELAEPAAWEAWKDGDRVLLLATRWRLLDEIDSFCGARGFPIDARTAVLIDLDKTAIGARGRNDRAVDRARIDAIQRTAEELLGSAPGWDDCRALYDRLNRAEFHRVTADSQDVVAAICLAIVGGMIPPEAVGEDGLANDLCERFGGADRRIGSIPGPVGDILLHCRSGGDAGVSPEFGAFRRNEYEATIRRMGRLPDGVSRERLLAEEITITEEVRAAALRWRDRGVTLLGLSDKPDAASLPADALAAAGYRPLHRTEARVIGGAD